MSKPTKQDMAQANQMLSREARLEDMATVAQLLADLRAARFGAIPCPNCNPAAEEASA